MVMGKGERRKSLLFPRCPDKHSPTRNLNLIFLLTIKVNSGSIESIEQGAFFKQEVIMAKNKPYGDDHRQGAIRDRSQVQNPHNDRLLSFPLAPLGRGSG